MLAYLLSVSTIPPYKDENMILEKDVLIKDFKGYGGFCVMSPKLVPFVSKDKDDKRKVRIEVMEEK